MKEKPDILIFIPARNEAATVGSVIADARMATEKVIAASGGGQVKVLVIDDGSSDNTSGVAHDRGAVVVRNEVGKGLGVVFSMAVSYAVENHFDLLVTIDGDGQFHSGDIPKLLESVLNNEVDFVTGCRFINGSVLKQMPYAKYWGNWLMSRLISSILQKKYYDVSCGFRVYSREALLHLNLFGGFTYTQEVFLNLGYKGLRIAEVPITVTYFSGRKSRIAGNLLRYAWGTVKIILQSVIYYTPLKLFGSLAALLFVLGLPVVTVLGVRYYMTDMISPYKSLGIVSIIFVVMSFVSLVMGIILQSISRVQLSADKLLYYERKNN